MKNTLCIPATILRYYLLFASLSECVVNQDKTWVCHVSELYFQGLCLCSEIDSNEEKLEEKQNTDYYKDSKWKIILSFIMTWITGIAAVVLPENVLLFVGLDLELEVISLLLKGSWTHMQRSRQTGTRHQPAADRAEHRWRPSGGHSGPVWEGGAPAPTPCCWHPDLWGQTSGWNSH